MLTRNIYIYHQTLTLFSQSTDFQNCDEVLYVMSFSLYKLHVLLVEETGVPGENH